MPAYHSGPFAIKETARCSRTSLYMIHPIYDGMKKFEEEIGFLSGFSEMVEKM
jgi:hypothetical protein